MAQRANQHKQNSEFYDLSERLLNSGDAYWGNLGYWQTGSDYSSACEALAHQLAIKVGLGVSSRIFDAGFGCGDQLLLWSEYYQVEFLCGINYSTSQTAVAQQRLAKSGTQGHFAQYIMEGDVTNNLLLTDLLTNKHHTVNTVLALDCAYHFPSRNTFFNDSFHILDKNGKGGCIGLTDIVLANPHLSWLKRKVLNTMLGLSKIPPENIVTLERYQQQLQQAGFQHINNQDISEYVLEPFGRWLKSSAIAKRKLKGHRSAWLKYKVTAAFLGWAYRNNVLRYIVITAQAKS